MSIKRMVSFVLCCGLMAGLMMVAPSASAATPFSIEQTLSEAGTSHFGYSIAIDGNTAVVGAYQPPQAAYVYVRVGDTWVLQDTLIPADIGAGDGYGCSVDIDGDTVIVGAQFHTPESVSGAGAAYIFVRSGSSWSLQQKIAADDKQPDDYFGLAVAVDGDAVLVGAPNEDEAASTAGAGYIFTRSGSTWTQRKKIVASDALGGESLGYSVALGSGTAALAAPFYDNSLAPVDQFGQGAVYIWTGSGSTWTLQQQVTQGPSPLNNQYLGWDVALSGDTIIAGAIGTSGQAYAYTRAAGVWSLQDTLDQPGWTPGDWFGSAVDVYGDTAVVTAPFHDVESAADAGTGYVFRRSGADWAWQKVIIRSGYAADDKLGLGAAIDANVVAVGADMVDAPGADSGAAYFYSTPAPVVLSPVYRFYNFTNNTHFFTDSAAERDHVIATWPNVYAFEGEAYRLNPANNTTRLTRLYNRVSGSHFYTASPGEAASALATWPAVFSLDGPTYRVNPGPVANSLPVYRFYNLKNGSHFYTASETEKNEVVAKYPTVYRLEGPAFWIGQ